MSYGQREEPCNQFRAWKGQEPLCGNCAWIEKDHDIAAKQKHVINEDFYWDITDCDDDFDGFLHIVSTRDGSEIKIEIKNILSALEFVKSVSPLP